MMRIVFLSVCALLAGALLFWLLQYDSGYILIAAANQTIEMRLSFALLAGIFLFFVLRFMLSLIRRMRLGLTGGWGMAKGSRQRRIKAKTHSGLIHYVEGNWLAAKKDLLKSAKGSEQPLIHYLAAARSAYELGDSESARALIQEAEKTCGNSELAVALSQARLQIQDQQFEQSLATLHRAKTLAPGHPVVLELLSKVYVQVKDWRALEILIPDLERHKALPHPQLDALARKALIGQMHDLQQRLQQAGSSDAESAQHELAEVWKRLPKSHRKEAGFALAYAQCLVLIGEAEQAERVLRDSLREQWADELVDFYGLLSDVDPKFLLEHLENWKRLHPDQASLYLALGRVCARCELWGQAKEYLNRSLALKEQAETHAELAQLLASEGELQASTQHYQMGLNLLLK